jgi:hypothetical protein
MAPAYMGERTKAPRNLAGPNQDCFLIFSYLSKAKKCEKIITTKVNFFFIFIEKKKIMKNGERKKYLFHAYSAETSFFFSLKIKKKVTMIVVIFSHFLAFER